MHGQRNIMCIYFTTKLNWYLITNKFDIHSKLFYVNTNCAILYNRGKEVKECIDQECYAKNKNDIHICVNELISTRD